MLSSQRDLLARPWWRETVSVLAATKVAWSYVGHDDASQKIMLGAAVFLYMLSPMDVTGFRLWNWGFSRYKTLADQELDDYDLTWEQAMANTNALTTTNDRYVVIGGTGFVGRRVVHFLLRRGEKDIVVVDMDKRGLADIDALYGPQSGVRTVMADVTNLEQITQVLQGAQCVFAVVGVLRYWECLPKHMARSYKVNVDGAKTLIKACLATGVTRLISTSTGNVTLLRPGYKFGDSPHDESAPRATTTTGLHNYAITKSQGEQIYLAANGPKLAVGVIRPCSNIFGPRDRTWFDVAQNGTLATMDASHPIDWVHVDDIVLAKMLLESRLRSGGYKDDAAGEAFNITGGKPLCSGIFQIMMKEEGERVGRTTKLVKLPGRLIAILSHVVDLLHVILPIDVAQWLGVLGQLTTSTMSAATVWDLRNADKARHILKYKPRKSIRMWIRSTWKEYVEGRVIMD